MDWKGTPAYAGAGVLATVAGLTAGHLTAALLTPASSPVLVVGSTVIDLTPTPIKEWAVREFGNNDKPVLIGSVLVGTLVLAAVAGVVTRRSFRAGVAILLGLVSVAGAMAALRPAFRTTDLLPVLGASVVGVAALAWLVRGLDGRGASPAGVRGDTEIAASRPSRRGVLLGAGVVGVTAVVLGGAGEWLARARTRIGDVVLPGPARSLPPLPAGLEEHLPGITPFRVTNDDFYRVDINLALPIVPVDDWDLTVDGDVDNPFTISFDTLTGGDFEVIERDITLTCVSNEVGGKYVGGTRWLGIRLTDLLDRAGVRDRADQILSTAEDGFTISTPLAVATDGRDALVAFGMDGRPLPAEHGFPVRLVTPGIYGYVGATKWLRRLTLTTYDDRSAYWTERGWATDAPIKIASRVDVPEPLSTIDAGETVMGGIAWAQHRGVGMVEVRIDGGAWQPARLGPDAGVDYWRQWYLPWKADPGRHLIAVRATTRDGDVQTPVRAGPFPDGSSGLQEIVVTVE